MLPTSMKVFGRDSGVIATRPRTYPIFVPILPVESLHVAMTVEVHGGALAFAENSHPSAYLSLAIRKGVRVDHHGGNCATDTATGSHARAILRCVRVFSGGTDCRLA
jgi:hypothetical protein